MFGPLSGGLYSLIDGLGGYTRPLRRLPNTPEGFVEFSGPIYGFIGNPFRGYDDMSGLVGHFDEIALLDICFFADIGGDRHLSEPLYLYQGHGKISSLNLLI
jgi:hypothetical protein